MKIACLLLALVIYSFGFTQQIEPITLTSQTISIPGALAVSSFKNKNPNKEFSYPKLFYKLAAGDEITIDFAIDNKKGTQTIVVSEYGTNATLYSNNNFQSLENIKIKIPKTTIYKFEFATKHMFDRQGKILIKRLPISIQTANLNNTVEWKTQADTTFITEEQDVKKETKFEAITIQNPLSLYLNSGSHAMFKGGKSRVTFPIILPNNTVE